MAATSSADVSPTSSNRGSPGNTMRLLHGKLLADGRPRFVPSTAEAIVELLKFHGVPLRGTRAAVIGRSTVIGRPAAYLLLKEDATVTIAHSQTPDIGAVTKNASVVVVGVGRA